MTNVILLNTQLRKSDFQHFQWFARHRLSVHIWSRNASAVKQVENNFAALRKNGQQKSIFILLAGLAGYKIVITNLALRSSLVIYHFIFSVPS